jgi:hypothetical protein
VSYSQNEADLVRSLIYMVRMCPATQFVHNKTYIIFSDILRRFSIDIYDGERRFHPVESCEDGMAFSQGPNPYRVTLQPRATA